MITLFAAVLSSHKMNVRTRKFVSKKVTKTRDFELARLRDYCMKRLLGSLSKQKF